MPTHWSVTGGPPPQQFSGSMRAMGSHSYAPSPGWPRAGGQHTPTVGHPLPSTAETVPGKQEASRKQRSLLREGAQAASPTRPVSPQSEQPEVLGMILPATNSAHGEAGAGEGDQAEEEEEEELGKAAGRRKGTSVLRMATSTICLISLPANFH